MSGRTILFDPACGDLARHFLSDEHPTDVRVAELASAIQQAIEDWLSENSLENMEATEQ